MPDDVATPTAAPEAAAPAETVAPADRPKAGTPELARWHGERAAVALAKEQAGQAAARTGDEPSGTPQKDPKTGRFLKGQKQKTRADAGPGEAHTLAQSGATPEPATKEKTPAKEEGNIPDSLAAVRRLASEGKFEEAFKRAFGKIPEEALTSKGWAAWRAESKKLYSTIDAKQKDVASKEQQMNQLRDELRAEFKPLHDAKKALEAGDLDEAFKLFAGTDFNTFSRNYLRQSTSPNVAKDPAIQALQKELADTRREMAEYRQKEQEQATQQSKAQAEREYLDGMVSALEASDDPRISRAAKRPAFQKKVLQVQREHYDPSSDWTLPHVEAAQLAIEALESEYGEWGDVFGGSASQPEPRGQSRTLPARAATPARPTARAVTTLSQKEAAEAASQPKLKGKALVEKYVAQANALLFKQNGVG